MAQYILVYTVYLKCSEKFRIEFATSKKDKYSSQNLVFDIQPPRSPDLKPSFLKQETTFLAYSRCFLKTDLFKASGNLPPVGEKYKEH